MNVEKSALIQKLLTSPRYGQAKGKAMSYAWVMGRNGALDRHDLVGEFHRGIAMALKEVKMDVGDPMEYLISRGMLWVKRVIRMESNHTIIEECVVCGRTRPYRQEPCARCGGRDFLLHPRFVAFLVGDHGEDLLPPSGAGPVQNRRQSLREAVAMDDIVDRAEV